jgi:H+-transporting ATPase
MSSSEGSHNKAVFKDVEKGNPGSESNRNSADFDDYADLNEYSALQKYITTYRDPKAMPTDDETAALQEAEDAKKNAKWWKFGRGGAKKVGGADTGVVPEDWLDTHISKGLTSAEVETRRKKSGWNELTTEKENMWLKFLSYFTGPILYGRIIFPNSANHTNSFYSHGTCGSPCCRYA